MNNKEFELKAEMLPCPICQAPTKWCDEVEVDGHCCDRIVCTGCLVSFDFEDTSEEGRDTLEELKEDNLKVFNTRHLPESVEKVLEAARKVVDAGQHVNEDCAWYHGFSCSCHMPELYDVIRNHDKGRK